MFDSCPRLLHYYRNTGYSQEFVDCWYLTEIWVRILRFDRRNNVVDYNFFWSFHENPSGCYYKHDRISITAWAVKIISWLLLKFLNSLSAGNKTNKNECYCLSCPSPLVPLMLVAWSNLWTRMLIPQSVILVVDSDSYKLLFCGSASHLLHFATFLPLFSEVKVKTLSFY